MAKIAEKLTILLETGNGFLIRLYNTKVKYTPENKERPSFLADPVFAKVVAAFVKKFPEIPSDLDKTPGYEVFLGKAKQIFEELEPDFDTFVDALEWVKITQQTLGDVANATADLTWAYTPVTTEKFLELVTMYCQVNLLWSLIADRRTIATCFARAFNIVRSQNESNFPKVAQYLANYSDPFKKLREDFKSFSKRVGQALVSLLPAYSKLNNLDQLRKEGTLNLTLNPERLALPSHDIAQLDLLNKDKMYTWAIYGHLFCPEELAMPGALDMCRVVLSQAYRTPVFRNVSIPIHNFYSDSWKNFKSKTFKLGKEKKIIVDGLQAATSGAGLIERRNFRIYLRQSLRSLLALLKDFPGLLGPKAVVVWSALAAAKAEVLWYFRHITAPPPKKDKFNEDALRDQHISELLFLTHQLSTLVRQHQRIMQAYYLEYLNEADRKALEDQVRGLPNHATVLPLLRNILGDLQAISVEAFMAGTDYNFDALRLNWARVEASLAAAASTIMPSAVKELIHRGRVICLHTRNVDEIEEQIEQYGSLKSLWYFRDSFVQVFDKSIIDGPANPLNCMAFLHLLAEFPENATGWLPREREVIGPQCVRLAEDMLNKITHRVASIVFEIGKHNLTFASQLNHVNGAHPLLARLKDYKFDKNYVPPTTPGTESHFRNRKELDNLRLYERNVQQLCAAMQDVVDVTIYDTVLTPREYLRDKLVEVLRRFVKKALIIDEQHLLIQRPSILESKLQLFVFTVRLLENYVAMDIASSLREFALGQVFNRHLSDINKIDFSFGDLDLNGPGAGSGSTIGTSISVGLESAVNGVGGGSAGATGPGGLSGGVGFGNDLAHVLSKWYADFMSRRLTTPGICYSVNRKAFISRADVRAVLPFRPEEYADLAELQALVRLVGPYGVRAIHRETMRFVAANIPAIKDVLALNRKVLNDVASSYHRDIAVHLKTLKEVDAFVNRSIAIGNALQFRQLLLEAQRLVAEKEMPYVSRTVANLFDQYPRNTFMKPEFLELDSLAVTLGLDLGSADQALKAVLCKVIGEQDKELWLLLPYMYAVSFVSSKVWAEAIYHPAIEGHANNVHTLSLAINALLIATRATSTSDNEREIIDLMKKFIEASSCILLKQAQQPPRQVEKVVQSLPSVLIFLDKFVEDSPFLQQESLESCLPYALLRSMYKQLYDTRTQGKKGKPVVAPGGGAGAAETAEDGM